MEGSVDFGISLNQCFSTFLLQRNPTQAWKSLTEPHKLIRASSYGLIFLARRRAPTRTSKQTNMTIYNIRFDRISRQQYVIVFNQKRWARWSSTAAWPSPPIQEIYHVNALILIFLADC